MDSHFANIVILVLCLRIANRILYINLSNSNYFSWDYETLKENPKTFNAVFLNKYDDCIFGLWKIISSYA